MNTHQPELKDEHSHQQSTGERIKGASHETHEEQWPFSYSATDLNSAGAFYQALVEPIPQQRMQEMVEREVTTQVNRAVSDLTKKFQEFLDARPVAVPAQLLGLASDRYELVSPVPIVIEQYEDEVTARWPEVEAFGAGDTESLAIAALRLDIVDRYTILQQTADADLGRSLLAIKRILTHAVMEEGNE